MDSPKLQRRLQRLIIKYKLINSKEKKKQNLENVVSRLRFIEKELKNTYKEYQRMPKKIFLSLIQMEINNIFNNYQNFVTPMNKQIHSQVEINSTSSSEGENSVDPLQLDNRIKEKQQTLEKNIKTNYKTEELQPQPQPQQQQQNKQQNQYPYNNQNQHQYQHSTARPGHLSSPDSTYDKQGQKINNHNNCNNETSKEENRNEKGIEKGIEKGNDKGIEKRNEKKKEDQKNEKNEEENKRMNINLLKNKNVEGEKANLETPNQELSDVHEVDNDEEKKKIKTDKEIRKMKNKTRKPYNVEKHWNNFFTALLEDIDEGNMEEATQELIRFFKRRIDKTKANHAVEDNMSNKMIRTSSSSYIRGKITSIQSSINLEGYKGINNIKKDILCSIVYPYTHSISTYINTVVNINGASGSGKTTLAYAIAGECNCNFFYIRLPEYIRYLNYDLKENKLELMFKHIKAKYERGIICIDDVDILFSSKEENIDVYLFTYLLEIFHNSNIIVLLLSINIPYESILYKKIQNYISVPIPTYEDRLEILNKVATEYNIQLDIPYAASNTYGFNRGQIFDLAKEILNVFNYSQVHIHVENNLQLQNTNTNINTNICNQEKEVNENGIQEENEYHNHNEQHNQSRYHNQSLNLNRSQSIHLKQNLNRNKRGEEQAQEENMKQQSDNMKNELIPRKIETYYKQEKTNDLCTGVKRKERMPDKVIAEKCEMKKKQKIRIKVSNSIIYESIKNIKKKIMTKNLCDVPNISLDNIGALNKIKKSLESKFILPVKYSTIYKHLGVNKSMGILLYGPPGCGKTMLAKAISNEMKANFIAIKGPEILNKYVGESEKKVREIFACAALYKPCLIFFDEIDSICTNRTGDKNSQVSERVVNQLLSEMDGITERENVYIIATTNRPEILDSALLRSGRFDQLIYVPLPTYQGRIDILKKLSKHMPIDKNVDFKKIARKTKGYSGADLSGVLTESAFIALQRCKQKFDDLDNIYSSLEKENTVPIVDENTSITLNQHEPHTDTCSDAISSTKDTVQNTSSNTHNKEYVQAEREELSTDTASTMLYQTYSQNRDEEKTIEHIKTYSNERNEEQDDPIKNIMNAPGNDMEGQATPIVENSKIDIMTKFFTTTQMKNNKKEKDPKELNNQIYEYIQRNKHILHIEEKHILAAIKVVPRSVSKAQIQHYKNIYQNYK